MAAFSDYLEAANLNHNLRGVPYPAPVVVEHIIGRQRLAKIVK